VAPLVCTHPASLAAAFLLALAGEFTGRWLFFVSVVPKNMAAAFSARTEVAA
jgi:DMSO reductase anchor subunit